VITVVEDITSGVEQQAVNVGDLEVKMPFVIRDSRLLAIYCLAPLKKLSKLLPNFGLAPAQMLPGRGLVQFTVYEHRDSDFGPYKELSVVVPLYSPQFTKLPFFNLRKSFEAGHVYNFLLHRAADSDLAVRIMDEHFLWPEFPVSVELTESDDWLTGEVKEGGELICRLRGRKMPPDQSMTTRYSIYVPRHHQPNRAEINFKQIATTRDSSSAELTLSPTHPIARELAAALKSTKSIMYVYSPSCQFVLYEREESAGTP
jgi:hypothetical protein